MSVYPKDALNNNFNKPSLFKTSSSFFRALNSRQKSNLNTLETNRSQSSFDVTNFLKSCNQLCKENYNLQENYRKDKFDFNKSKWNGYKYLKNPELKKKKVNRDRIHLQSNIIRSVSHPITGDNQYMEKTKADMINVADNFNKMDDVEFFRISSHLIKRYDTYSVLNGVDYSINSYKPKSTLNVLNFNKTKLNQITSSMAKVNKNISLKRK